MATNKNDDLTRKHDGPDRNPDPITDAPGSHPTGTAIGSASGAATGAALGAIGGPVGAIIGGVAGAIVGGGVGHAAGEWNDPTEDEAYWRNNYTDRPYVKQGDTYDTYADAYRYGGAAARERHSGRSDSSEPGMVDKTKAAVSNAGAKIKDAVTPDDSESDFDRHENDMRADWQQKHGSSLDWDRARPAVRDAYDHSLKGRQERLARARGAQNDSAAKI